jgi:hypothetical protein
VDDISEPDEGPSLDELAGPTAAEMRALVAEEPVIEAEVAVTAAEIDVLASPSELAWRRLRAAERALITAWLIYAATHRPGPGDRWVA